ncbi:unnamed protein product [Polarella glacialis]|uniref:Uncharacterized protein n=1 Tax=Polarella glacialis TaxID=89957 RepID=A0A813EMG1_POLGL|nr:unnamed protein product [Polarella glacialis]
MLGVQRRAEGSEATAAIATTAATTITISATTSSEQRHEAFELLLDQLFDLGRSLCDLEALEAAFQHVVAAVADDRWLALFLWRRALPLLDVEAQVRIPKLLGFIIDHQLGFRADPDTNAANDFHVDTPPSDGAVSCGVVVFLFGWGGGTLSDMEDIRGLYREIFPGATLVLLTSNLKESFGLRCECAVAIRAALRAWSSTTPGAKRRLLVHLFSNSGFHTWTEMLQSWSVLTSSDKPVLGVQLPRLEAVLRGVILDSACDSRVPLDSCLQSSVQSVAGLVNQAASMDHDGSDAGRKEAEVAGKKAMHVRIGNHSPVKEYLLKKTSSSLTRLASADTCRVHRLEPPVNLQFIYSEDDSVISSEAVERYIREVQERPGRKGVALERTLKLKKSKHCFHKVNHREEYWRCVRLFASSVLAG